MKRNIIVLACAVVASAAVLQPLGTMAQSAKPAVISLADLKRQLVMAQNQISATVGSLQQLKVSAKNPDALPKALTDYETRYRALETQVETVRSQAVWVKARSKAHYEAWQKELVAVENPQIREKAQARLSQSREEFEKIIATAERAKEETLPFVSDLKDILLYLQADLSDEALKSLSNTIWKIGNRSKSVIGSLDDVNEQIERTIKSLPQK